MRRAVTLLALLALSVVAQLALAQQGKRVVLVGQAHPELSRKLEAEATNAGFTVVELFSETAAASDVELLKSQDAIAIVRVVGVDRVELAIGGREPELRALEQRPGEGDAFALRAVEELRARLIELKLIEPPVAPAPEPKAAPSPPSPAPVPARSEPAPLAAPAADPGPTPASGAPGDARIWLRGGAGALAPLGGVGPTGMAILGVGGEPFAESWELSLLAMLPLTENEVAEPEGEAEVGVNAFVAEIEHHAAFTDKWFLSAGVGGGVLVLATRAETIAPFEAHEDTLVAGIYYLHVGAVRRVAPWLRLRASLLGGVSAPRPVIRFDDRDVAAWGRAFGGVMIGAELGMPLGRTASR